MSSLPRNKMPSRSNHHSLPASFIPQGGCPAGSYHSCAHMLQGFLPGDSSLVVTLSDTLNFDRLNRRNHKGYSDSFTPTPFDLFPGRDSFYRTCKLSIQVFCQWRIYLFPLFYFPDLCLMKPTKTPKCYLSIGSSV